MESSEFCVYMKSLYLKSFVKISQFFISFSIYSLSNNERNAVFCSIYFTKFQMGKKYFTPSVKLGANFNSPCLLQKHFHLENKNYILVLWSRCEYLNTIPQIDEEMHQDEYAWRKK